MRSTSRAVVLGVVCLLCAGGCDQAKQGGEEVPAKLPDRGSVLVVNEESPPAGPNIDPNNLGVDKALSSDILGQKREAKAYDKAKALKAIEESLNTEQHSIIGGSDVQHALGNLDSTGVQGVSGGVGGLGLRGMGVGGGGGTYGRIGISGKLAMGRGKGASLSGARRLEVEKALRAGQGRRGEGGEDVEREGLVRGLERPAVRVNPMTEVSKDRLSTFAVDVDTGSYTLARASLRAGSLPSPETVRVEEFVNYFAYDYPSPDEGPFGVSLEAAPSPFSVAQNRYIVRVGVQGERIKPADRKPAHLTFLVDVSGSMGGPDRLGLAKQALKHLTAQLKPSDTVALVTYASGSKVVLAHTSDKQKIHKALDDLTAHGATSMSQGMELAYKEALKVRREGHISRVIVLSDGDANIGASGHGEILKQIRSYVEEGVTLSTIGFGMGNYRDDMMEQLANKGNGNYHYIDDLSEAKKVFGEQVDGTLQVIAKDVKIQVEFDPKTVARYRLIGYENRAIADRDFRNDKVDAGEIGAGHTVTALYEVDLLGPVAAADHLATVRVRHKLPEGHKASERSFELTGAQVHAKLAKASKSFQLATAAAAFAELLRGSPYMKGASQLSFALVEEIAAGATSRNQKDRKELVELIRLAAKLRG